MAYTILVVDDDSDLIRLYVLMLERGGFAVVTASDGEKALDIVSQSPPDLILLDDIMPGLNGHEVCRAIRANPETAHIPVVMCSARGGNDVRAAEIEAGANGSLVKPFSPQQALDCIRSYLHG